MPDKKWWQSASLWISVAYAVIACVNDLITLGHIGQNTMNAIAALTGLNVAGRKIVEGVTSKAKVISGAVKDASSNP